VQVQSKVGLKYDAWHKEVVSKFGNMLGTEMVDFHGQVSKVCGCVCATHISSFPFCCVLSSRSALLLSCIFIVSMSHSHVKLASRGGLMV